MSQWDMDPEELRRRAEAFEQAAGDMREFREALQRVMGDFWERRARKEGDAFAEKLENTSDADMWRELRGGENEGQKG